MLEKYQIGILVKPKSEGGISFAYVVMAILIIGFLGCFYLAN